MRESRGDAGREAFKDSAMLGAKIWEELPRPSIQTLRRMRARGDRTQQNEVVIACNILNRMTELGRPESYPVGR